MQKGARDTAINWISKRQFPAGVPVSTSTSIPTLASPRFNPPDHRPATRLNRQRLQNRASMDHLDQGAVKDRIDQLVTRVVDEFNLYYVVFDNKSCRASGKYK